MRLKALPYAIILGALPAFDAAATVHYVDLNCTNPVAPYTSWDTAATNINNAILSSPDGDIILVTNGVYQTGSIGNAARVNVFHRLTVQSVNGPSVTVIKGAWDVATNGPNALRCVYLVAGSVLSGFTLTNGATLVSGTGGGVLAGADCLITNCILTGNAAYSAGGGAYGGTLVNCVLTGNKVLMGGGSGGGGAQNSTLINCLLTRNFSSYFGAAVVTSVLTNCTVVSNSAAMYAGAAWNSTFKNCIVYYNNSNYTNADDSGPYNNWTNCCIPFALVLGVNNVTNPPSFANFAAGDYHLLPWSPCINSGSNAFISLSTDLDGNPRIVGGTVDMGAFESQYTGTVHYVRMINPGNVPPYTNWPNAAGNIQDAIDVAVDGDFVVVSNGIYQTGGRVVFGTMTNRVVVDKAITVVGYNGSKVTTIAGLPGAGAYPYPLGGMRCVYLTNGAALVGFTLTNGATRGNGAEIVREQSGGAIWCESTNARISDCVVVYSYANMFGGGAYQGTLNNCTISNDTAFISGGGTYLANLSNCVVSGNQLIQGSGGGGAAYGNLEQCLIVGNFAPGYGGGAFSNTLNHCAVSNNVAGFGGGVAGGLAVNSLISSNSTRSSGSGGGAWSNTLFNCVVIINHSFGSGSGAYGCTLASCTVVSNISSITAAGVQNSLLTNCIVYYNYGSTPLNYAGSILNYCDTFPLSTGLGNITSPPAFVDLANGNLRLQSNSPCINSGNNGYVATATDFDGNPRIAGGTVDIGAYEFQSPSSVLSYAWAQQYGLPIDGSADYTDADGDSMNNWQEWRARTVPTDASSLLKMYSPANIDNSSGITVSWQSVASANYFLQRSDLATPAVFSNIQSNIAGLAGTTSFTDASATNAGPYFYRVGVQ